ncbi:MAG: Hsp20 family protein, partial [Bacteroidota bacterium]
VEADAIVANYENGILSVTLPKKEEEKEKGPRMVEIA